MEFFNSHERILVESESETQSQFLTDYSPTDKPFDTNKAFNGEVLNMLASSDKLSHQRQAERMMVCAERLEFGWVLESTQTGQVKLRLKSADFCRVRHCPICQWRRSLMWVARFFEALPKIHAAFPEMRYIMLTATVRNCQIDDLRAVVNDMSAGWKRLSERKSFPALGFVRSLEVTRGKDGSAHPHIHVLLAVPPSYFNGRNYLSKDDWAKLWGDSMRLDYKPVCDVRIVKFNAKKSRLVLDADASDQDKMKAALLGAITEVIKYTTKPDDMVKDKAWLLKLVDQMRGVRSVSMGGIFKQFLKESESNQDLIAGSETEIEQQITNEGGVYFGWRKKIKRYVRKDN